MENLILSMLVEEIAEELANSSVKTVSGLPPLSFAIQTTRTERTASSVLVVCLDPRLPALFSFQGFESEPASETPAENLPEGFVRSMCDMLSGTVLNGIAQHDSDRVVKIGFSGRSGRQLFTLWLELFGRRPSAVLVGHDGNRIEACSREGTTSSAGILLRPGGKYSPPSQADKLDVETLSPHVLQAMMEEQGDSKNPERLGLALSRLVRGLSPHAAREVIEDVLSRQRPEPELMLGQLKKALARPGEYFRPAVTAIPSGLASPPVLLPVSAGKTETGTEATDSFVSFTTALEAARFSFFQLCRWYRLVSATRLRRHATALSEKLARLKALLLEELSSAEKAHDFRTTGELLLANLNNVKRGSTFAELRDIHVDGQFLVRVGLDPSLSVLDNAERYFKKARKAQRALALLRKRTVLLENSLQKVQEFRAGIPDEVDATKSEELSRELDELANRVRVPGAAAARKRGGGVFSARRTDASGHVARTGREERVSQAATGRKSASRSGAGAEFNPRTYETKEGYTIIVGRNNRENDYVTHRLAKSEDLWFHASGMPGSHVVLRSRGKSAPSRKAIEEAASIAAYFSKGRTSSGVPVIYTEKKYVHKPRGARPGTATCARERFLMVTPRKP